MTTIDDMVYGDTYVVCPYPFESSYLSQYGCRGHCHCHYGCNREHHSRAVSNRETKHVDNRIRTGQARWVCMRVYV